MNEDLYLKNYDYVLENELIARFPKDKKEEARLLVYDIKKDEIKHAHFYDFVELLPPCDVFFNDTLVIKARLFGKKENGSLRELFINELLECGVYAQIKGRIKEGDKLYFENGFYAIIIKNLQDGLKEVKFYKEKKELLKGELLELLDRFGHVPLPPYLKREDEKADEINYQSIFAKNAGAVAAPTASLHFSKDLLEKIKKKHNIHTLTLHVGAGTFKSVTCENIKDHAMHKEYFKIPLSSAQVIDSKTPILCVGTTVTRTVEYYYKTHQLEGFCDLFLHPLSKPARINHLLTNFHLPKSTLIMLVASFIGREKTLELYEEAKRLKYRFYSYGDAMLILNNL